MSERWIEIVGWEKFQHYRDRRPIWIKNYLDLLNNDDVPGAHRDTSGRFSTACG